MKIFGCLGSLTTVFKKKVEKGKDLKEVLGKIKRMLQDEDLSKREKAKAV
jgi:hypothetical protein